jgi:hypothetical protein
LLIQSKSAKKQSLKSLLEVTRKISVGDEAVPFLFLYREGHSISLLDPANW